MVKSVVGVLNAAVGAIVVIALTVGQPTRPTQALPELSRRYGVACSACHTVAPQLNTFGLAYQANHFNWPGDDPPAYHTGVASFPISGIVTGNSIVSDNSLGDLTFQSLKLFEIGGVRGGPLSGAGYFVSLIAATPPNFTWTADLRDSYASVPVLGSKFSLTFGQFTPLQYQYDIENSLTLSPLVALFNTVGSFSASGASPGIRIDYFDHRGSFKPDGFYVDAGVSTDGHLSLMRDQTRVGSAQGAYVHAFTRKGYNSIGVLGYVDGDVSDVIALGTLGMRNKMFVTGVGSVSHDMSGSKTLVGLQGEYSLNPKYAGTIQGNYDGHTTYPVYTLTAYPFDDRSIRITAESIQDPGLRSTQIVLQGQF